MKPATLKVGIWRSNIASPMQNDRLRAIFTELIRRQVLVIVLAGFGAVLHSVRASPIPIVFNTGDDPIQTGPLWTGFRRSEEGRRACEFF
jgi:hypothetical protein